MESTSTLLVADRDPSVRRVEGLPASLALDGQAAIERAVASQWTMERLEREYLLATLERHGWRQAVVAEILGINRRTIYRKLKRYREQGLISDLPE